MYSNACIRNVMSQTLHAQRFVDQDRLLELRDVEESKVHRLVRERRCKGAPHDDLPRPFTYEFIELLLRVELLLYRLRDIFLELLARQGLEGVKAKLLKQVLTHLALAFDHWWKACEEARLWVNLSDIL